MAMVGDALVAAGLSVAPMSAVLQHEAALDGALLPEERARQTLAALGLDHVAQASIRAQGAAVWLDYRVYSRGGHVTVGSLRDGNAMALGERFAQELAELLRSSSPAEVHFPSTDPFVNEALGRANECLAQELWADAEALYNVVARLVPDDLSVQNNRLRCLAALDDPRALWLGQTLLGNPQVQADSELAGRAHFAVGRMLYRAGTDEARQRAEHHLAEALQLARQHRLAEWAVQVQIFLATVRMGAGDYPQALAAAQQAEAAAREGGQDKLAALVQQILAVIDTVSGDLLLAQQRLEDLTAYHLKHRHLVSAALGLSWQAMCAQELGLVDSAEALATRMLDLLETTELHESSSAMVSSAALVFADLANPQQLGPVLARLTGAGDPSRPGLQAPCLATQGVWHLSQGDSARARQLLQETFTLSLASMGPLFARSWGVLLLRVCLASGQWQEAKAVRDQLAQLPGHERDPMLQGNLLHAKACDAWRQGRRRASMVMLTQLIEEYPLTRAQAAARMDLAWLLLEDGDTDRAERILGGNSAWRQQHACGLTIQAQLRYARGAYAEAVDLQQQALARHRGAVPVSQQALAEAYAAAAAGQAGPLPKLPVWVSLSWLAA